MQHIPPNKLITGSQVWAIVCIRLRTVRCYSLLCKKLCVRKQVIIYRRWLHR